MSYSNVTRAKVLCCKETILTLFLFWFWSKKSEAQEKKPRWRDSHYHLWLIDIYPVFITTSISSGATAPFLEWRRISYFYPTLNLSDSLELRLRTTCDFCRAWDTNVGHDLGTATVTQKARCSPVTYITWPIFVCGAACTSSNSINILVAFRGVFSKINPSTKHSSYVCMSFIKSFMNNGINERRT